jgi:hypothetical protein
MTPAEELAELRRLDELEAKAALAKPQEEGFISRHTPDVLKNVGTAIYKGVAGLGAGAADALNGSYDYTDGVRAMNDLPVRKLDPSMPLSRALDATGYQPKTQGEKYVNMAVRGAAGAALGPGSLANVPRTMLAGAASGLGSEAAGQLPGIKGTPSEGVARVAGALAGGSGASLLLAPVKNAKQLAGEMLEGVKPEELEAAKKAMVQAKIAGVPVNLDQAMGKDTNITNVINALVGRKEGQKVVDQLRAQPDLVKGLMERLTKILPGKVRENADIANDTQAAATAALNRAREMRTKATQPLFESAGTMPPEMLDDMITQATTAAKNHPDTNKGQLFADMVELLKNAKKRNSPQPIESGMLDANGNPLMTPASPISMKELNDTMRTKLTNSKNVNTLNASAGDKEAIGGLQKMIGNFRDQMGAHSKDFKDANELYSLISKVRVDPMKKSVIGRVAGISGETADAEAVNKILPILARGRNPKADTSEITEFAKVTGHTPRIFQDAFKTHFSNLASAAEKQSKGALSPGIAGEMEKNLLGNANQRAGMKDALEAIAVGQGKPKDSIYPGFMAAMKIIAAASKRPGAMGPNGEALNQIAGQSHVASGLRMIGLAPGKPAAAGLQGWLTADAYRTLADNLTTAEGVAKLQALAKVPIMSTKAQAIVNTLLATKAVATPDEVTNVTPGDNEKKAD